MFLCKHNVTEESFVDERAKNIVRLAADMGMH
jgi:hypothetical protein